MRLKMKEIREEKNLTQEEMAKLILTSRSNYANIELGNSNPSFDLSLRIKKVLQNKNDDIFINTNV